MFDSKNSNFFKLIHDLYSLILLIVELRCTPPVITDKYMTYQCPDGFTYGSQCSLRCMGRFPLIGNDTIVCEIKENSTKSPPSTYWDKGDIEPHCKRKD